MRFVRAYVHPTTGELSHMRTGDLPFGDDDPGVHVHELVDGVLSNKTEFVLHDLGVSEHFIPKHPVDGRRCSHAAHLFHRMEHIVAAPPELTGIKRFKAKDGHELPLIHAVPTNLSAIRDHLRRHGPDSFPERVAYWLEFMGALSPEEMDAHGLPRMRLKHYVEFDRVWTERNHGSKSTLHVFKRHLRERHHQHAARRGGG